MPSDRAPFHRRVEPIFVVFAWVALGVGTVFAALDVESAGRVVGASVLGGAWVVGWHAIPAERRQHRIVGELIAVLGVAATLGATALTNGSESPFLLLGLAPTLFAATTLGARVSLEIAALSIAGLAVIATLLDRPVVATTVAIAAVLHLVVAGGFAQLRRTYLEEEERSAALLRESAATEKRLKRLEASHNLLLEFSRMADPSQLNPVAAGHQALTSLRESVPFDAGLAAISGESGPVVVARVGDEVVPHHRTTFPLRSGMGEVGFVVLSRAAGFSDDERARVAEALRPVELVFANLSLLRDIAQRAVREERTRLARELHDEIGPSLASVGLALDVAVLQHPVEPALGRHLEQLRSSVSHLVDDIRTTVTDLRATGQPTLTQLAREVGADAGDDGPKITVHIDERRPPRRSLADDVASIVTEAMRNALRHAGATNLRVSGYVDRADGKLTIEDDGRGFRPDDVPASRYGVVGMRERAARIDGRLTVESTPGVGTTVSIEWGPS